MLFPQNVGDHLSIDEVAITNGELYTVVTDKKARGKKNALVAMVEGTKSGDIARVLNQIPLKQRNTVTEVTMDIAEWMEAAVRASFLRAKIVTDRFHVQQLVSDAVQEMRITLRRDAIKEENEAIKEARAEGKQYAPFVYENGDTKKQLLARSRYLLFKPTAVFSQVMSVPRFFSANTRRSKPPISFR
jgi:transposase